MARHIPDAAYTAYFAYFTACTNLVLTSDVSTPGNLNNVLATAVITSGDFSTGTGTPTGRRLTVAAQNGIDVAENGTTRHAVLVYDPTGSPELRLITTCSERLVSYTDGDKVNMGSFYLQVAAPVAP